MVELKDLLGRLRNILVGEEEKKEVIRSAISSIINTEISSDDIKVKNGTIYLNIKPIYKNEIFLKKEKILSKIEEMLGNKAPKNLL